MADELGTSIGGDLKPHAHRPSLRGLSPAGAAPGFPTPPPADATHGLQLEPRCPALTRIIVGIMKLIPPLSWHGGKSRFTSKIIALFPPHQTFIDVFGGSGAVLLAKQPSPVEVYNDIDAGLVNLFRGIHDPKLCNQLQKACAATLYARSEFMLALEPTDDPVERARRFLVRQRMSRSGLGERWSWVVDDSRRGMASVVRRWQATVERLSALHQRLRTVQIEHADWREILARYDNTKILYYLDPPYQHDTRNGGGYSCEMTRADHSELVGATAPAQGHGHFVWLSAPSLPTT
jgi:DNA adenine methylase